VTAPSRGDRTEPAWWSRPVANGACGIWNWSPTAYRNGCCLWSQGSFVPIRMSIQSMCQPNAGAMFSCRRPWGNRTFKTAITLVSQVTNVVPWRKGRRLLDQWTRHRGCTGVRPLTPAGCPAPCRITFRFDRRTPPATPVAVTGCKFQSLRFGILPPRLSGWSHSIESFAMRPQHTVYG